MASVKNNNNSLMRAALLGVLATLLPYSSTVLGWSATLSPPVSNSPSRLPSEAIRIALPHDIAPEALNELVVRIDGNMVSDLSVVHSICAQGGSVAYLPSTPLNIGFHKLQLLQEDENNGYIERGVWNIQIGSTEEVVWHPKLAAPLNGDRWATSEALEITLPGNLPDANYGYLALELDNVDISRYVEVVGNRIIYQPAQPMAAGEHQLRIVEYSETGKIVERGAWQLDVGAVDQAYSYGKEREHYNDYASNSDRSSTTGGYGVTPNVAARRQSSGAAVQVKPVSSTLSAQLTVSERYRFEDKDLVNPPDRDQLSGSAVIRGEHRGDRWRTQGTANVLIDSHGVEVTDRDKVTVELGEYVVAGVSDNAAVYVGHHDLGHQTLIMNGFNRRGASVTLGNSDKVSASAFGYRTETVTGTEVGVLGLNEERHRVTGTAVNASLKPDDPDAFRVTGIYLQGEGGNTGVAVGGASHNQSGSAWSIGASSRVLEKRLTIKAEFAQTEFDFDGNGSAVNETEDQAHAFSLLYSPWKEKLIGNEPVYLTFGLEHKEVGAKFQSLANQGLQKDLRITQATTAFNGLGWYTSAYAFHKTNNVNDSPVLPKYETDGAGLSAMYSPYYNSPGKGLEHWWGTPTLLAGLKVSDLDTLSNPSNDRDLELEEWSSELMMGATFQYEGWNWAVNHKFNRFEDDQGHKSDTEGHNTTLGVNFNVSQDWSLQLQYQRNESDDLDKSIETLDQRFGIGSTVVLNPKLTGRFALNLGRQKVSDDSADSDSTDFNFNLTWLLQRANEERPGFSAFLEGASSVFDDNNDSSKSTDRNQIFLGVSMDLPVSNSW